MDKTYIASVRDKETKRIMIIERDGYRTKTEFRADLIGNGYAIRFITTEEEFDADCEKYHQKLETRKAVRSCLKGVDTRRAADLGLTLRAYRNLYK